MAGKRSTDKWQGARPFGEVLDALTARVEKKRRLTGKRLAKHWPEIIGAELAKSSAPERVLRHEGKSVLLIRADGGSGVEVQHMADKILARIEEITGQGEIERIKLLHGPPELAEQAYTPKKSKKKLPRKSVSDNKK